MREKNQWSRPQILYITAFRLEIAFQDILHSRTVEFRAVAIAATARLPSRGTAGRRTMTSNDARIPSIRIARLMPLQGSALVEENCVNQDDQILKVQVTYVASTANVTALVLYEWAEVAE
jgi:hypothetical protein